MHYRLCLIGIHKREAYSASMDFAQNLRTHYLRIVPMTPSRRRQRYEDKGTQTG